MCCWKEEDAFCVFIREEVFTWLRVMKCRPTVGDLSFVIRLPAARRWPRTFQSSSTIITVTDRWLSSWKCLELTLLMLHQSSMVIVFKLVKVIKIDRRNRSSSSRHKTFPCASNFPMFNAMTRQHLQLILIPKKSEKRKSLERFSTWTLQL